MSNPGNTTTKRISHYLQRAYGLDGTDEKTKNLYDEWADIYDKDNNDVGYASPRRAVDTVIKNLSSASPAQLKIFDAGCGTGIVGDCLAQSSLGGKFVLDGVDLSEGMLAAARKKNFYRDLETANLNERIAKTDGAYDVVLCIGTLTKAHVGPKVLSEFARVAVKDGLVVATVHDEIYESGGYRAEIERLQDAGTVQIVSTDAFGILEENNEGGKMVVLKKL